MDFSLEQSTFQLNGSHDVTGWSDDADALSFPNIDLASIKRGAGGKSVSISTGEKGGPVILKLLANSPTTKFLMNALSAQLNGAAITWTALFREPINQISVAMARGTLSNGPLGPTIGKGDVKNAEFTFEFETVIPVYEAATI